MNYGTLKKKTSHLNIPTAFLLKSLTFRIATSSVCTLGWISTRVKHKLKTDADATERQHSSFFPQFVFTCQLSVYTVSIYAHTVVSFCVKSSKQKQANMLSWDSAQSHVKGTVHPNCRIVDYPEEWGHKTISPLIMRSADQPVRCCLISSGIMKSLWWCHQANLSRNPV